MFNKLGLLLVSALILFSSAIYAHEDRNVAALNGYYLDSSLCLAAAEKAGEKYGVSYDLLQTISAVESGKWSDLHNTYIAWPWTINVNGKGYYFESKEEAVEAIKKFQAKGYNSIDVGCMQINLKYHGDAFASVEEALNPENNVQYSAKFLRSLYSRYGNDWQKAAKRYHSANVKEGDVYAARLEKRFDIYKSFGLSEEAELF